MQDSSESSKAKRGAGRPLERSREQVENALREGGGRIARAARLCGCSYDSICNDLERWPELQKVRQECREAKIDDTEDELDKLVKAGNVAAICFFLKCQGKHRGYVERTETTGPDGGPLKSEVELSGQIATTAEIVFGASPAALDAILSQALGGSTKSSGKPKTKRPK